MEVEEKHSTVYPIKRCREEGKHVRLTCNCKKRQREWHAFSRPRRGNSTILTCLSRSPAIWSASGGLVRASASHDRHWTLLHRVAVNCACLLGCVTSTVTSNPPCPRPFSGGCAMGCEHLRCAIGYGCCGPAGRRHGGFGCGYDYDPWSSSGCVPWTSIGSLADHALQTRIGSCACCHHVPWIWIGCDLCCGRVRQTWSGIPWSSIGSVPWTWIGCVHLIWTGCVPWTWNDCDGPLTSNGCVVWTLTHRVPSIGCAPWILSGFCFSTWNGFF